MAWLKVTVTVRNIGLIISHPNQEMERLFFKDPWARCDDKVDDPVIIRQTHLPCPISIPSASPMGVSWYGTSSTQKRPLQSQTPIRNIVDGLFLFLLLLSETLLRLALAGTLLQLIHIQNFSGSWSRNLFMA
ncbi:hypothetical protein BO70DRAFT_104174 [Aspergillus heteromorphus CBS 117.55]|uniref:Uncharacterized protein n=1 Tax=Aspergillus heteromorphus CBS 117.55 TaxID=1448321 RepID=A0A317VMZ8_9EURO|nr:uncharacterized protein BO70DRAFT_104174 [Aspergillus heteromorphus CBS 117.55]PWY74308.1 hypothetical protein BO70DRAFT_104174 [Aspergillus heteromorphus CBS 117.55]